MTTVKKFSLSSKDALPETVEVDGSAFNIRSDYRTVLRCFKLIDDKNVPEEHKPLILYKMFFADKVPRNGMNAFMDFVRCGEHPGEPSMDTDFDFEQDAQEIYSGFVQLYGIDLFETNMHWYKFRALLGGVFSSDTALSKKVEIRHSKDSDSKKRADADRARRNAEIKQSLTAKEERAQDEIIRRLQSGESLQGVI